MDKTKIISSSIIAIALIFIGYKLSTTWEKTHVSYNNIGVTGLGTKNFDSDLIVWSASFSRNAATLSEANTLIKTDIDAVKSFLEKNGINENEIAFTSLKINRNYRQLYNNEGNPTGSVFEGYNLFQEVIIESKNLAAVEKSTTEIGDLIEKGIEFTSNEPDYYYTKLADLKLELLKNATQDALKRAQTIAENASSHIGKLKEAEMGVFQITGQNTNEDYSWGGSFNTKAKHKTASITVKLSFEL
ncbi:MAG: SIMPL domain-containing protein [Bacteroidia bacterium]|nr:SIMPL domain-containing protein [Bacteroidia bacterium]